jgi:hypothetical protein
LGVAKNRVRSFDGHLNYDIRRFWIHDGFPMTTEPPGTLPFTAASLFAGELDETMGWEFGFARLTAGL